MGRRDRGRADQSTLAKGEINHLPVDWPKMDSLMQQPASDRPRYTVKETKTIMADPLIRARLFTLAPREIIPWHRHSEVTDHYFVLAGILTVQTRFANACRELTIGDHFQITPGKDHTLRNLGATDCRFLLLQGAGRYDWIDC
jgi:quercetin dioxygenase-like cupin family protein